MGFPPPASTACLLITALATVGTPIPATPDPAPDRAGTQTAMLATVRVPAAAVRRETPAAGRLPARAPCLPATAVQQSMTAQRRNLIAAALSAHPLTSILRVAAVTPVAVAADAASSPLVLSCLLPPTAGLRPPRR
ncbi:hypothetical protein [Catenuloplanes japonicus]|uniref:hypothetical protein n=1 Tax=Catenuloplanes japonicus TaxID=33876 RepID=UPI0012FB5604|nr:hypothetical protein [Catenuloplanes japonicus]